MNSKQSIFWERRSALLLFLFILFHISHSETPSAGCGKKFSAHFTTDPTGNNWLHIQSLSEKFHQSSVFYNLTRYFFLTTPAENTYPTPLIISLHGWTSNATDQLKD